MTHDPFIKLGCQCEGRGTCDWCTTSRAQGEVARWRKAIREITDGGDSLVALAAWASRMRRERDEAAKESHTWRNAAEALAWKPDPLHPNGRCTCGGGGQCEWCQATRKQEVSDGPGECSDRKSEPRTIARGPSPEPAPVRDRKECSDSEDLTVKEPGSVIGRDWAHGEAHLIVTSVLGGPYDDPETRSHIRHTAQRLRQWYLRGLRRGEQAYAFGYRMGLADARDAAERTRVIDHVEQLFAQYHDWGTADAVNEIERLMAREAEDDLP